MSLTTPPATTPVRDQLRQMLALLEGERQALAGLNLEQILTAASDKLTLCNLLEQCDRSEIDEECRGLLDAVRRLNEVNRRLRNLISSNMQARLAALTGSVSLYSHGLAGSSYR